jgi:hypothetical protein
MKFLKLIALAGATYLAALLFYGCSSTAVQSTLYPTISTVEVAVDTANRAYLELVVTGQISTNSTTKVEQAFNDTKMALLAAAVAASGGTNAAVPVLTMSKATAFTNTVNAAVLLK